jgi:hypothetical protein
MKDGGRARSVSSVGAWSWGLGANRPRELCADDQSTDETRGIRGVRPGNEVCDSGRWDFSHTVRATRDEQVRNLLHDRRTTEHRYAHSHGDRGNERRGRGWPQNLRADEQVWEIPRDLSGSVVDCGEHVWRRGATQVAATTCAERIQECKCRPAGNIARR